MLANGQFESIAAANAAAEWGSRPRVLNQAAVPFILAGGTAGAGTNQFTMGNNGALSTLPALPATYSSGAFIFMPANGIFAGSTAGWYWFVASSTTAGQVFNNQYVSGDPRLAIPASPTPFVSTGPGLVSQINTFVNALSLVVPGGSMGPNGCFRLGHTLYTTNNANSKNSQCNFGSMNQLNFYSLVFAGGSHFEARGPTVYNRNSTQRQVCVQSYATSVGEAFVNSVRLGGTVDTTVDQNLVLQLQLASAPNQDYLILEGYNLTIQYGA